MPGNVSTANPLTVMPWALCRAFQHSRSYPVLSNEYANGELQIALQASTSRKSWRIGFSVDAATVLSFRSFFEARKGGHQPFYFYDVWETVPKFSYDETGTDLNGRYVVRFDGPWEQALTLGRLTIPSLQLIELA